MIRCDVKQDGNIWPEIVNIIQLKTTYLHHIPRTGLFRYLPCKTVAYITYHCHIIIRIFQDGMGKFCRSALPVTSCYRNYLTVSLIPETKFYLAAYLYPRGSYLLHYRHLFTDTRALYKACCIQYFITGMYPFFKFNFLL